MNTILRIILKAVMITCVISWIALLILMSFAIILAFDKRERLAGVFGLILWVYAIRSIRRNYKDFIEIFKSI
jgi:hypothetical protein